MNSRFLIFAAAFVIFVAGAWMALQPPQLQELPAPSAAAAIAPAPAPVSALQPQKLDAASVLAIDPRTPGKRPAVPVRQTLTNEYLAARQYRALYDRLKSSAEGTTAEGAYVLYEIANRCANITDRPRRNFGNAAKPLEQRRDEFLAGIQPGDPMRDRRVAAFEEVNTNKCLGFESISMTQADLNKMLADAVSLGDPKARALAIEQEINAARRGRWDSGTLSETQIDGLRQAIGTKDPAAMVLAGRLLSTGYNDLTMRVGPNGQVAEPRAMYNAWQILACDYGLPVRRHQRSPAAGVRVPGALRRVEPARLPALLRELAARLAAHRAIPGPAAHGDRVGRLVAAEPRARAAAAGRAARPAALNNYWKSQRRDARGAEQRKAFVYFLVWTRLR
jgi:hypothetical protein